MALEGNFYRVALIAQASAYGLAVAGLLTRRGGRAASAAASFLVLNAAAWMAFWVWIAGRADRSWQKVSYAPSPPAGTASREPASAVS
jgi:hypothetical protein